MTLVRFTSPVYLELPEEVRGRAWARAQTTERGGVCVTACVFMCACLSLCKKCRQNPSFIKSLSPYSLDYTTDHQSAPLRSPLAGGGACKKSKVVAASPHTYFYLIPAFPTHLYHAKSASPFPSWRLQRRCPSPTPMNAPAAPKHVARAAEAAVKVAAST